MNIGPASPFEPASTEYFVREAAAHSFLSIDRAAAVLYVIRGSLELVDPESRIEVGQKELVLVSTQRSRSLSFHNSSDSAWYVLQFCPFDSDASEPIESADMFVHVRPVRPERVTDLLRRCFKEQTPEPAAKLILAHLIRLILAEIRISRQEGDPPSEGQGVLEVISSRVDAYIAAHYHEPISTFEIARELRYNPDYLERAYRQECRISIREAILTRRLREARAQLVLQRGCSVAEIAEMCGFNDMSYFRRAFKRATSMTPYRYRSVRRSARATAELAEDSWKRSGSLPGCPPSVNIEQRTNGLLGEPSQSAVEALNSGFFVSSGYGTHARRVLDTYELIFVTRGCLDLYEGERHYHLEKNQSLLLVPGVVHGGLTPFEPELNFYWIHFRIRRASLGDSALCVPKTANVTDPELLTELFCMFISDQESGKLTEGSAANLVSLMLCAVGRSGEHAGGRRAAPKRRTEPNLLAMAIEEFIDCNFDKPISTSTIAKALDFSADYLERVHREHGGTSIVQSLHERRIKAAREQLRTGTSRNINEIAFACGYNDSGYFRRVFKRLTALTPKQYRSMFVQTHINTH